MVLRRLKYPLRRLYGELYVKYLSKVIFVHINKTGGSSIERALGLPFQHRTARQIRADLGDKRWNQRFSFAFVRNPWDKVASHYRYRVRTNQTGLGDNTIPFTEWVKRAYGDHDATYYDHAMMFMPQLDWITDETGTVIVDFVGRFERLHEDFELVCRQIGRNAELPHVKSSGVYDYREMYDEDAREVVARCFSPDIHRFGYSFD